MWSSFSVVIGLQERRLFPYRGHGLWAVQDGAANAWIFKMVFFIVGLLEYFAQPR